LKNKLLIVDNMEDMHTAELQHRWIKYMHVRETNIFHRQ